MSTVQASNRLLSLIEQWADSCIKSAALVDKIIKQAATEALSGPDCRELLESALRKRGLEERQIRKLIPDEFKHQSMVREQFAAKSAANSTTNDADISKLKEKFETIQSEVRQLRTLLAPFKAGTTIEIRGNVIPITLEVDPQSRRIIRAEVNEAEARRINS